MRQETTAAIKFYGPILYNNGWDVDKQFQRLTGKGSLQQ